MAKLILQDGTVFQGEPFGASCSTDGEVVFNTGMAGYPESITDPSYRGQILVFTYPLIGNYGVPSMEKNKWGFSENFESEGVHVRGVIVANASADYSHFTAASSLHNFLDHHGIPGITGVDTRALTKKLREHGVMLGRIENDSEDSKEKCHGEPVESMTRDMSSVRRAQDDISIADPNLLNLVDEVSCKEVVTYDPDGEVRATVAVFDCGIKNNILRSWLKRGVKVHRLPWNFDLAGSDLNYDGIFISNGPGDPKMCTDTIEQVKKGIDSDIPTFGICLGTQILALAVGGDTYKLKYGHRGVNQPCLEAGDQNHKCIITSQNHGFAVGDDLPSGWNTWFTNANDKTVEGIKHESGKFFAVQFHPEATPGPEDANYLFDEFLSVIVK